MLQMTELKITADHRTKITLCPVKCVNTCLGILNMDRNLLALIIMSDQSQIPIFSSEMMINVYRLFKAVHNI